MSNGTILNGVNANRIHRSNAAEVRDDADSMLTYYRDRLMILAATAPHSVDEGDGPMPWDFYVRREIDEMWDELQDQVLRRFMANYVLTWPEDCVDDYDAVAGAEGGAE